METSESSEQKDFGPHPNTNKDYYVKDEVNDCLFNLTLEMLNSKKSNKVGSSVWYTAMKKYFPSIMMTLATAMKWPTQSQQ